ncbi:MAG TPA: histidine phosphatase family protein [Alphaproteobacteria bacterium]|jgi:phosphohistidine phosphatase
MKTLYLLRHAKSSWGAPDSPDHERPLNGRGRLAAEAMGGHLGRRKPPPETILASTALRVRETLDILLPKAKLAEVPLIPEQDLYLAEPDRLLTALREAPADAGSLMMVGHNPGMHEFALRLCGEVTEAKRTLREQLRENLPTAGLVVIAFPLADDWGDIGWGDGRLDDFVTPKSLA